MKSSNSSQHSFTVATILCSVLLWFVDHTFPMANPWVVWIAFFPIRALRAVAEGSGMSQDNAIVYTLLIAGPLLLFYWFALIHSFRNLILWARSKLLIRE